MRSYEDGTGEVLDRSTARLLLDPDFAVGLGVSREQGRIAIGHEGANEGYLARFLALPRLGQGMAVMTDNDAGAALTTAVADALSWPWTGWSTPLWAVLVAASGLIAVVALAGWMLPRRGRGRRRGRGLGRG